jgi:hypothetical protein
MTIFTYNIKKLYNMAKQTIIELPVKIALKGASHEDAENLYNANWNEEYLKANPSLQKYKEQHEEKLRLQQAKKLFPLSQMGSLTPENIEFLKFEAQAIVYGKGADDVRQGLTKSGIKVISSCDAGRGLLLHPDGKLEVGNPYELWDRYLYNDRIGETYVPEISAIGTYSGRRYYITHLVINKPSSKQENHESQNV